MQSQSRLVSNPPRQIRSIPPPTDRVSFPGVIPEGRRFGSCIECFHPVPYFVAADGYRSRSS